MGLSIKNEETERLVRELAKRRGIGVTSAIRLAVNNELAKIDAPKKDPEKIRAAVREIQERVAARGGLPSREEMDDFLYGPDGLPH